MSKHEIKCWPRYFEALLNGSKTFEYRLDNRGYMEGDILFIHEWDNVQEVYTGRTLTRRIGFIMCDGPHWPMKIGYAILSLHYIEEPS